ncbi:hypothetical protein ACQQ32_005645 [Pseudomonas aeruginosa]|nr:hypothetical protein [Pseudomonas aeruginosa]
MTLSRTILTATEIADVVARKIGAAEHGVAITVQSKAGDKFFVIWKATSVGVQSHELSCGCCDVARLEAHARGFIQNMAA